MPSSTVVSAPDPHPDRQVSAFMAFCQRLTPDQRIGIVKSFRPEWTVRQIADLCGVSPRTVLRAPSYRRLRAIDRDRPFAPTKWRGRARRRIDAPPDGRGFSNPNSPDG
jgi:hypothetical protein